MLFRSAVYLGLSLSWISPSGLGQLSRRFLSHLPRIVIKSHLTQLFYMVSVDQIHALLLLTDQVFSLAKDVTFLNNGPLLVYVVTFIYLFLSLYMVLLQCSQEESSSEQ